MYFLSLTNGLNYKLDSRFMIYPNHIKFFRIYVEYRTMSTTKSRSKSKKTVKGEVPILKTPDSGESSMEQIHTKLQNFLELGCVPETTNPSSENIHMEMDTVVAEDSADNVNKKRGRKPRGGKLILRNGDQPSTAPIVSNIILHLKCSMNDLNDYNSKLSRMMTDPLEYNPTIPPEIITYNDVPKGFTTFDEYDNANNTVAESNTHSSGICVRCKGKCDVDNSLGVIESDEGSNTVDIKEVNAKLKMLKVKLYKNAVQLDKKAACFWCTYDFDNTPCHIPKYEMDETIYGYGSFCRPECAVAFLMKENIDDSTKFERYQLLNQIYSKVYGCKKNIKPAPNPYYLLEKYYGNLSIQEYRKLLKTEHLLLTIDKPMTRILPELHEDNEDMIMNIYGINKGTESISGVYKVKRQSEKPQGPSKASIIRNKFGLA